MSEITISSNSLQELQKMFGSNVNISINISECREFARSFHTSDFGSSITPDLLSQDHSLRQFYEILTNQHGLRRLDFRNSCKLLVDFRYLVIMKFLPIILTSCSVSILFYFQSQFLRG